MFGTKNREIERLKKELTEQKSLNETLKSCHRRQIKATDGVIEDLKSKLEATEKERDVYAEKIRKQTEADLLMNALEAVGIVKDIPKKKKEIYVNRHEELLRQQAEAQNIYAQGLTNAYRQSANNYPQSLLSGVFGQ